METKKEEKKIDMIGNLREGNISLVLDSYNDIFSDFDPRTYSEKALSDDFLIECKKAARDKEGKLELRFLVPKEKRNLKDEIRIRKRLKEHFHRHFLEEQRGIKIMRLEGIVWFVIGAILMLLATFLIGFENKNFVYKLLIIIIEPAGWFFFWEGLNFVFLRSKEKLLDYSFYKKMSHSEICFLDY
jgi:hypothetical protein